MSVTDCYSIRTLLFGNAEVRITPKMLKHLQNILFSPWIVSLLCTTVVATIKVLNDVYENSGSYKKLEFDKWSWRMIELQDKKC